MMVTKGFLYLTSADFIVRAAYQMGKTPLLPLFAAALGAGGALLGFIVSISTLTGMVLKPFVGVLSDRWGRRAWLVLGTALFTGMPFLYRFVGTPEQLVVLRIAHGMATAIYGPVTLAYVAAISRERRSERLAWFALARKSGYVLGPAAAGWMLLTMDPVAVFTVIGLLSSLAFAPVLLLPVKPMEGNPNSASLLQHALRSLRAGGRTPAIWVAGGLESSINVALYAAKAFLPLYALSIGASLVMAGAFFSIQETFHICTNPVGGRISDRIGTLPTLSAGLGLLGAALALITMAGSGLALMGPAAIIGLGQALVFPSSLARVSSSISEARLGAGMGLVGSLGNAGKVIGPILAGFLIGWLDFAYTFRLLGGFLLLAALAISFSTIKIRRHFASIRFKKPSGQHVP